MGITQPSAKQGMLEKLIAQARRRFKRKRFQNFVDEHLLQTGLDALASTDNSIVADWLARPSVANYCVALDKHVKGAGKLMGIKTGFALQTLDYFPIDETPDLGDGENAYGYARAMTHNVLVGDPSGSTWIKSKAKRKKASNMNKLGYVKPTQRQVKLIFNLARGAPWVKAAKRWYDKRCEENPTSKRWKKVMKHLYLKARTALQFESYTCEQGNREKKVRAGGSTQHWSPSEPRKTYDSVRRQLFPTAR